MKHRVFNTRLEEYDLMDELSDARIVLVKKAMEAAADAYAPYSDFRVGVAVRLQNGEIITGNNQENAAYPSGLCAERVALFYAGSRFPAAAAECMAIAALRGGTFLEEPVSPCGACRQVLLESEARGGRPLEVILFGTRKIIVFRQSADLLPLPFVLKIK
jgi:cytidine deaminase